MESTSFARLMVTIASERSARGVLDAAVHGIAGCPKVILARSWVLEGDELKLAAGAGNPATEHALDDAFPFARAQPILAAGLRGHESWIPDLLWARAEMLRSFAAQPLEADGQVLGVLGVFDRGLLHAGDFDWLRVLADLTAVCFRNARASETPPHILTRQELREEERANLAAAVEACGGKVFGPGGAAELLGMKPTTLASRIAVLGLKAKKKRTKKSR